jgi:hypothetical protein
MSREFIGIKRPTWPPFALWSAKDWMPSVLRSGISKRGPWSYSQVAPLATTRGGSTPTTESIVEICYAPYYNYSTHVGADEIILVDTGSTDGTMELARAAGARVFERPWDDDFAAPRTLAASHARGRWVLQLDADERLSPASIPALRAALRREFGGEEGAAFAEYLAENCFDLHYVAKPGAQPYSFGLGNLWRIAVAYPGCPVPPCVHRAPETAPGRPARLLLIS